MPELEKVKCSTPDFAEETAKKILALLPECAGEGGEVDLDKLKQCLSSKAIEGNVERYQFTWPGKRAAMAAASAATTKTLRPCASESVGRDGKPGGFDSENLYIEGDNLEVLKLLQTSYANQVKMIYIDPPYNTGHDFVYRDRFSLTQKELESEAGVFDEDGNRFEVNDSAEARYHSNWCSMMYPRLKLARNLLRDDGVIFISIDDNEVTNTRKLCDEVFGESNLIANLIWKSKSGGANDSRFMAIDHEYVICYCKNSDVLEFNLDKDATVTTSYNLRDEKGAYSLDRLDKQSLGYHESLDFPIIGPDGKEYRVIHKNPKQKVARWRWGRETVAARYNELVFKDGFVYTKNYQKDGGIPRSLLIEDRFGRTRTGKTECAALFGVELFDNPKPTKLIKYLMNITIGREDIVMDFFSGSSTTAQSLMQLNAEEGSSSKFIMVQLPEVIDPEKLSGGAKKTAQAAVEFLDSIGKPHVICEIAKERIRRSGKKISEENATNAPNLDIGFRVLKLDTSSLRDTSATVSETDQEFANFERVRSDRSAEDLLFQMLLETHIQLSESIMNAKVAGNKVLFVGCDGKGDGAIQNAPLAACLDAKAKMTTEFFLEIAKLKPGIAFFRDDAFVDDSARTNLQQAFTQFSPTTSIKVI